MVAVIRRVDPSRTKHASQATHLSDLLTLRFARECFGTEVPRTLRVTEPDGPSTDGGRKARQAILLCPKREDLSSNMVCGFIDVATHHAELRSYAAVKAHFERRHQRPVDITRGEYNRMIDLVQSFLASQDYETRMTTPPPPRAKSVLGRRAIQATTERRNLTPIAISFLVGFLLCYLLAELGVVAG